MDKELQTMEKGEIFAWAYFLHSFDVLNHINGQYIKNKMKSTGMDGTQALDALFQMNK